MLLRERLPQLFRVALQVVGKPRVGCEGGGVWLDFAYGESD
jgi:hypothetical protein